jgi:hypothetical protein
VGVGLFLWFFENCTVVKSYLAGITGRLPFVWLVALFVDSGALLPAFWLVVGFWDWTP